MTYRCHKNGPLGLRGPKSREVPGALWKERTHNSHLQISVLAFVVVVIDNIAICRETGIPNIYQKLLISSWRPLCIFSTALLTPLVILPRAETVEWPEATLWALTISFLKNHLFIWLCQVSWTMQVLSSIWTLQLPCTRISVVAACRLSCSVVYGILALQLGIKPMSPALQGNFLYTAVPGKSQQSLLITNSSIALSSTHLSPATLVDPMLLFSRQVLSGSSATLWTVSRQAPLSMGFPRQEYCSGLSFPSPGDLLNPGIELAFPALAGGFFTTEPPGMLTTWTNTPVDPTTWQARCLYRFDTNKSKLIRRFPQNSNLSYFFVTSYPLGSVL